MSILGTLLGGGLKLAGSLIGQSKEQKLQKQFAKNAIQWKVQDAEAAGIHPLYALGANTVSYAPMGLGSQLGDIGGEMGQDISRAIAAPQDSKERASDYTRSLQALQLERGSLENELLRGQIRNVNAAGSPPVSPDVKSTEIIDGQGDTRAPVSAFGVTVKPRASETPAQDLENEYGEASDFVGGARLLRDADAPVTAAMKNYFWSQWEKIRRGEPNDLFYVKGRGRGWYPDPRVFKTNRERR
ncbi:MAG: DNA pilot protein [Arizlama microvirus]|nr:MAG: DNA pilot protein [Arizlama microvirus]